MHPVANHLEGGTDTTPYQCGCAAIVAGATITVDLACIVMEAYAVCQLPIFPREGPLFVNEA